MTDILKETAVHRILNELTDIEDNEDLSSIIISVEMVNHNPLDLVAGVIGPPDTPYEGGTFKLEITVPEKYPFVPVKMRFLTKIWHANISSATGKISTYILENDWDPCIELKTVLLSVHRLLCSPELDSPQDVTVAKQYKENKEMFDLTAKYWTQFYAGAPGCIPEFKYKIKNLVDRGVDEETTLSVLSSCYWNAEEACDLIFN